MSKYAWVTLATNDCYSLGALVLAHSLKKCNTIHKLAVLITPSVSQPMREQLQSIFDVVKLVDVLDSKDEAHLALMKRPELGITFTKIHCWKLIEFEKCVFLDADTLAVRNCDELFEREEFSAAPDVSWPDCFNSGVFVYKPSIETFTKILQYAVEKGSFDGGDQGLLNQYFGNWATQDIKKHLPFVYNLTAVAAYSYVPAFKHYGSETRIVHFIGTEKPWLQKLDPSTKNVVPTTGSEHLTPLLQKWWDVFSENVHPKLDKSLDFANGMSSLSVEACSNHFAVDPETSDMLEPCAECKEINNLRQHNLPHYPFVLKELPKESLNLQFLPAPVNFLNDASNFCEKRQKEKEEELQKKKNQISEKKKGQNNINEVVFYKTDGNNRTELKDLKHNFCDVVELNEFHQNKKTEEINFCEKVKKNQSNLQFLVTNSSDVPIVNETQANKETTENNNKFEICEISYVKNENNNNKTKGEPDSEGKVEKEKNANDRDDSNSLMLDETCINNYLNKNIEMYQPFQNSTFRHHVDCDNSSLFSYNKAVDKEKELLQPVLTLPRFLTIPESDKRQSGNCFSGSFESNLPVNELNKKSTEFNIEKTILSPVRCNSSEKAQNNAPEIETSKSSIDAKENSFVLKNNVEPEKYSESCDSIIPSNQKISFSKSKSMPNLEMFENSRTESEPKSKINKLIRKYSLPKLKPLIPRQNEALKSKSSSTLKITQYTEFLISSEYKEPVDLPKDKIGFVDSQFLSLRRKSDVIVKEKFGPIPYTSLIQRNEFSVSNYKKPLRDYSNHVDVYDLKTCKRQMGNKPKENSSEKNSTPTLPALKPLLPYRNKKSNFSKKRKSRELSCYLLEKRFKKENEALIEDEQYKRSTISINDISPKNIEEKNDLQEILKRLQNFSKNYLHYFGRENGLDEKDKNLPFSYEDYEATELKQVFEGTWSNWGTGSGITSKTMIFGKGLQDFSSSSLTDDKLFCVPKNNSKKNSMLDERQTEKTENQVKSENNEIKIIDFHTTSEDKASQVLMHKQEFKFNSNSDLPKSEIKNYFCDKIIPLRVARIWQKKFQISCGMIGNSKNEDVKLMSIIALPWSEKDRKVMMELSEAIENKNLSKKNSCINYLKNVECDHTKADKIGNKFKGLFVKEINLKESFANCNGESSEKEVIKVESMPEAQEDQNPKQSTGSSQYSRGTLNATEKYKHLNNFNEVAAKKDTKPFYDEYVTKREDTKNLNTKNKNKMKKKMEFLGITNFETPRSSRVEFISKEIVSDVLNEMIETAVREKPPEIYSSVSSKKIASASSVSPPTSYKTVPNLTDPNSSTITENKLLVPKKKSRGCEIFADASLVDATRNKKTNKPIDFVDSPFSHYHDCIVKDLLEAAETDSKTVGSGITGTIAQLSLDSGDRNESSEASSSAYQEYIRRQNWETGNIDYMGKDSFDNIWSKICESLNEKTLEDPKGNLKVLNQKSGDQTILLEKQVEKPQSKPEKEIVELVMDKGMPKTEFQPAKQTELAGKISELPSKEIPSNVLKTTAEISLSMNQPKEANVPNKMASDQPVLSMESPVVRPTTIESPKVPTTTISSNVSGTDVKLTSSFVEPEKKVQQASIPTSLPPLITETPATPMSETKAEDELKIVSPIPPQKEQPQKAFPINTGSSDSVNKDAKTVPSDSQTNVQLTESKSEIKSDLCDSKIPKASPDSAVPNLGTKLISSSQIEQTTSEPGPKTKEPIPSIPTPVPCTPTTPVNVQAETKPKDPIISTAEAKPLTTIASTLPASSLPTSGSVAQSMLNSSSLADAAKTPPATSLEQPKSEALTQQTVTPITNKDSKVSPLATPSAATESSKIGSQLESQLKSDLLTKAGADAESVSTDKSSNETLKQESSVKLSDILQPKGPVEMSKVEAKDKPPAKEAEQGTNTAVVPYCDVLKQAQGVVEKEKEKEKPRSQKSIEELKKRQSEIKASQLPPIALPDSPVKTQTDFFKNEEKNEAAEPVSQQVTPGESKDQRPKISGEGSLKDNGKQKKGMFSKILEIVGVSPKEKKEDETESSKSVFYDCEGIPSAEKKQDLITNKSSIKTVSEVPEKPVADTSKKQGEISSTKANEEGVPTSKPSRDEAKTTNTDKSKDVNCDKKKTSNMLQSETSSDGVNKQDKQKTKETQPKQEDCQSGNKKNKAKAKPPRNTAPSPPKKTEETKQSDNKDKKKESPNTNLPKMMQKQDSLPKTDAVLPTPSPDTKETKDSPSQIQAPEVEAAESKIKECLEKKPTDEKIKSDLDEILNKAKTEAEARIQEKMQENSEGLVSDISEAPNTMKALVGDDKKPENQAAGKKDTKNTQQQNKQKPQKDGKFNKRGPQGQMPPQSAKTEEIEEVKVTSEEDRKKHKGQVTTSKLSDQILKAIPPPRRKAISDSKGEAQPQESTATNSDKQPSEAAVSSGQEQPQQQQQQLDNSSPNPELKPQPSAGKPSNAPGGGKPANATENAKQSNANHPENKKGETKTKSASGPVPPPRNRSKPRQPTPPKGKSKK